MADMGKTEVDAVSQELVSAFVQKQLIQSAKLMPLVQNFAAGPGIDLIKIPRTGDFTADTKTENTALTAQVLTMAADSLPLDQYKAILTRLEDNAGLQSTPNVVKEIVERQARQLALDIDTYIVTKLEAASAAAPDHRVAYDNSGTADTLGQADILTARELLHIQNIVFSECFIGVNPASESNLLAIDSFVHADTYGDARGIRNGELGRLYGAPVIMSNEFDEKKTIVWHPTAVAFARQMDPKVEHQRAPLGYLADDFAMSNLYGAVTLDSGKRQVMLGTAV